MTKTAKHVPIALERRARQIVDSFGGRWSGRQGMCCCPAHDDRTPSLSVGLTSNAILLHCFAGCTSDDVLEGLKRHGIQPRDLFDGKGGPITRATKSFGPDANACRLWRETVPLADTLAERYLAKRSIPLRSSELRYLERTPLGRKPDVRFFPALIAAVRMDIGIVAIHRTFLDPVTASKADLSKPKRALGQLGTGAVRLSEPLNGRLGLAEGAESALSAQTLVGIPCWATLGNERFGIVSIPESVTELHLFVDNDKGGDLALKRGMAAYARAGRTIIPHKPDRPGDDWNDALREQLGTTAAV